VVVVGETLTEPDAAPPVENPEPVHEPAPVEPQVNKAGKGEDEPPLGTIAGLAEIDAERLLRKKDTAWLGFTPAAAK
jgi:hypothetical protein